MAESIAWVIHSELNEVEEMNFMSLLESCLAKASLESLAEFIIVIIKVEGRLILKA